MVSMPPPAAIGTTNVIGRVVSPPGVCACGGTTAPIAIARTAAARVRAERMLVPSPSCDLVIVALWCLLGGGDGNPPPLPRQTSRPAGRVAVDFVVLQPLWQ